MSFDVALSRLQETLARMGLPPLRGIRGMQRVGSIAYHSLQFDGNQQDLILGRQIWPDGTDAFQRMLASHVALTLDDIPTVGGFQILPPGSMPYPAAIWTDHGGVSPRSGAVSVDRILADLGRTQQKLLGTRLPKSGVRGDMGRFTTVKGCWSQDIAYLLERERLGCIQAGCTLDVVHTLQQKIENGLSQLNVSFAPTLIHFGLDADCLRYVGTGEEAVLVSVDGWEHGLAGDPVATLAPFVARMTTPQLEGVLHHTNKAEMDALMDASAMDRLETYVALYALNRLRHAAEEVVHAPGPDTSARFQRACARGMRCSAQGYARHQFERATSGTHVDEAPLTHGPDHGPANVALLHFGSQTIPLSDRLPYLLAVFSSADLANATSGDVRAHFLQMGHHFLAASNTGKGALRALGPSDYESWQRQLIQEVQDACLAGGPAMAISILAAGLHVIDSVDNAVPGRCLHGLEATVRASLSRESEKRHENALPATLRAMHGILGYDAAIRLGCTKIAEVWKAQTMDALDVLHLDTGAGAKASSDPFEALLPLWHRDLYFSGDGLLVYPVLAAGLRLWQAGKLPGSPNAVMKLCSDTIQTK